MRTLALELAPDMIRVNSIHPTTVDTPMVNNEATFKLFRPDLEHPTMPRTSARPRRCMNALPIPYVDAVDISNALLFLASDEARYITGVAAAGRRRRGREVAARRRESTWDDWTARSRSSRARRRGQGRSHALRLAQEGADIIAVDVVKQLPTVEYAMSTPDDLAETVRQVEALDRRIVAREADVRDYDALKAALDEGVAELGRLDIVSANAGIFSAASGRRALRRRVERDDRRQPHGRLAHGEGGDPAPEGGGRRLDHHHELDRGHQGVRELRPLRRRRSTASSGLMRTLALELAPDMIRVNTVHPTSVDTPMIQNEMLYALFAPDLEPSATHARRARRAVPGDERPADPVGRAGRHLERRAVARLRRGALRDRSDVARRRRIDHEVTTDEEAR